jgi:hypothetical protein
MIWISAIVTLFMVAILLIKPDPKFYPYDRSHAEQDIRKGQVRLISFGFAAPAPDANRISIKYGFIECNHGCVVGYSPEEKEYTDIVTEYLERRNGKDWKVRYQHELDSMRIAQEEKNP